MMWTRCLLRVAALALAPASTSAYFPYATFFDGQSWQSALFVPALRLPSFSSLFAPSTGAGTVLSPAVLADIQKIIDDSNLPGVSLAVVLRGSEAEKEFTSFGVRSEDGDAMTADTLFTIASCSKAFLAAALGLLMDDYAHGRNATPLPAGLTRLDWDTRLAELLPGEWVLMDDWATKHAALKDILSHTSGLPRHDYSYHRGDTPASVLPRLRLLRPASELREQYSYNNMMYMVGAHLLDTYAGSYTSFARERLFVPLNMSDSTFVPSEAHATGRATHTWSKDGRRVPWWFTDDDYTLTMGPGGVIASAEGLANWLAVLLNEGVDPATNTTVLPKEVFETITTSRTVDVGHGSKTESIAGYGLGWMRVSYLGHDIVWHSGRVTGLGTLVMFAPQDGVGLTVLTNADNSAAANKKIAHRIFRAAFGLSEEADPNAADAPRAILKTPAAADTSGDDDERPTPLPGGVDFSGAYSAAGYGPGFVLCNTSSTSVHCLETLAVFRSTLGGADADLRAADLFGAWPRVKSSHVWLAHREGTRFALRMPSLFPDGYGKNRSAFMLRGADEANAPWVECLVEKGAVRGCGVFGLAEQRTLREKRRGDVEERADVWFERVV